MVQGCSRGLGLEMATQLLRQPEYQRVVGMCRNPQQASPQLQALQEQHGGRLQLVACDVTVEDNRHDSIETAAARVADLVPCLHLLINTAGVLHVRGVLSPETSLSRVTMGSLMLSAATNAFGPILVSKHLAPLLVNAAEAGALPERPAVIANLSARVGSIGDNHLGGWYSYRASKAALNQLTKTMSLEFQRRKQPVAAICLHPGTCDTDLSAPFQRNVPPEKLFTRERAVEQLLRIIDRTTMADTGRFIAWDGSPVEW